MNQLKYNVAGATLKYCLQKTVQGICQHNCQNQQSTESAFDPSGSSGPNLDIWTKQVFTGLLVVVKEFTLNRCPFQ
jgi:hypothetical protein